MADHDFGLIFRGMYNGSLCGCGPIIMSVWPYAISNRDHTGHVTLAPEVIAAVIGQISVEDVCRAIQALCDPDPRGGRQQPEALEMVPEAYKEAARRGCRLVRIPSDPNRYYVVKHEYYRASYSAARRRQLAAERARKHRIRKAREGNSQAPPLVNTGKSVTLERDASRTVTFSSQHVGTKVPTGDSRIPESATPALESGVASDSVELTDWDRKQMELYKDEPYIAQKIVARRRAENAAARR